MLGTGRIRNIYQGKDPLDLPAYTFPEVAHCLGVPIATIRAWSLGRPYQSERGGERWAQALVRIADKDTPALSFRNLVELHVLSGIRRKYGIKMPAIRRAIAYLREHLGVRCPLSDQQMLTDGKDLLVECYGRLISVSEGGQVVMKKLVEAYLSRIERDQAGSPIRLFPFTRPDIERAPRLVVMNPRVQFGRPCIAGTGIPTSIVFERYRAGDTINGLAQDYRQSLANIEEAIRYEVGARAA